MYNESLVLRNKQKTADEKHVYMLAELFNK